MGNCVADHKEYNNMNALLDSMGNDMEEDTSNSVSNIQLDSPSCWIKYSDAELKQLLLYAAIELDSVRASAQSQRQAHETLIEHLEELVESARRERDETREQCVSLINQLAARTDDSYNKIDTPHHPSMLACMNSLNTGDHIKTQENLKSLPERGKLVEAVVRAGPLLQTLLVAGPLPEWRYPPPSPPQLINTPQITNIPFPPLPPPALRYNDFCSCCIYNNNNNNAGGFAPPSFRDCRTHLSSPWEGDRRRQVLEAPLKFIHADENGLNFQGNAHINVGFNYGSEECREGQTMMPTVTIPAMGSTEVGLQPASNFGSEKACFIPPISIIGMPITGTDNALRGWQYPGNL